MTTTKIVLPPIDYSARDAATYPSEEWILADMRIMAVQILHWKIMYYNMDGSTVDDQEYDLWWNNLLWLEARYPHLKDADSVTKNPGAPVPADLQAFYK